MNTNSKVSEDTGFLGILNQLVSYSGGSSPERRASEKVKLHRVWKKESLLLTDCIAG